MLISHKGEDNEANMKQLAWNLQRLSISCRKTQLGLAEGEARSVKRDDKQPGERTALGACPGGEDPEITIEANDWER